MGKLSIITLLIFSAITLTSCTNEEENVRLKNQVTALEAQVAQLKSWSAKQTIINEYLAEKNKATEQEVIKAFWEINTEEVIGDIPLNLNNKDLLRFLQNGGGIDAVNWGGYTIKRLLESAPIFYKKIAEPKNIKALYEKNKGAIKKTTFLSPTLQEYYRDADIIADYFSGNIESTLEQSFKNYFKKYDGEILSRSYFLNSKELSTEEKAVLKHFNDKKEAFSHYTLWLSAKRQNKRFGDEWVKTFADIMRDFGNL